MSEERGSTNKEQTGRAQDARAEIGALNTEATDLVKNISGRYVSDIEVLKEEIKLLSTEGELKENETIEEVDAQALHCYQVAVVAGICTSVSAWRAGEALKRVWLRFMARKEEVKAAGQKLKDEPMIWTTWMKANNINPMTASRYMRLYDNNTLKDVVGKHLMDLPSHDWATLERYAKDPKPVGTVVKAGLGLKLDVNGKESKFPDGSCFRIVDVSKAGTEHEEVIADVLTGKHKNKQVVLSLVRIGDMKAIQESEIKEPVVPKRKPRSPKKDKPDAPDKPGVAARTAKPPKPPKPKITKDGFYSLALDQMVMELNSDKSVTIRMGTYIGMVEEDYFTVLSGDHAGTRFSGDVRSAIAGEVSAGDVAKFWVGAPPAIFHVEVNMALAKLHEAVTAVANTHKFTALESAFLYQWKNKVKYQDSQ